MSFHFSAEKPFTVRSPESSKEWEDYYQLRYNILRKPWNQSPGSEKDEQESTAIHIAVFSFSENIIGCGRAHKISEGFQIRYMAVEENHRGLGIGSLVLKELENRISKFFSGKIILQSRVQAVPFYEKNGYQVVKQGNTLYNSIPHFWMEKKIENC